MTNVGGITLLLALTLFIETLRFSPDCDKLVGTGIFRTVLLFKMGTGLCKFIELNMHFTYL
jgi:hypothetical protein